MRTSIKSICVLVLILVMTSCLKENHTVRLKNDYPLQINNVVVGTANLGNVPSGSTSDYQSISTGDFDISGVASNGAPLSGGGTISGKGKHKWTITISNAGSIKMTEDK